MCIKESELLNELIFQECSLAHQSVNKVHGCAIRLARGDLCGDGAARHHNVDWHLEFAPRPCICRSGVASTEGDQAAALHLCLTEVLDHVRHAIQHAAHFVRAGALQVF